MSNPSQGASFNDQDFALNQIAPNVPKINSNSKKLLNKKDLEVLAEVELDSEEVNNQLVRMFI